MADQKRLELVLDPSKAQSGAKLAVQAVKSVGRQADITANKVGNISRAFDQVLAKLNTVNSKSPDKVFQKLNSTVSVTGDLSKELSSKLDKIVDVLQNLNKGVKETDTSMTRYERVLKNARTKTDMLNTEIGKQIVLERDKHKEITKGILEQKKANAALTEAEQAQKRLKDAYQKSLTEYRELNDTTRKSTIFLQESTKQQEMYQRALVDSLTTTNWLSIRMVLLKRLPKNRLL
jgi:predicted  nucleic acid-binding Zn-ribbon protein